MERGSSAVAALLVLFCWAATSAGQLNNYRAELRRYRDHYPQWRGPLRPPNTIETMPRWHHGLQTGRPAARAGTALYSLLNGILHRGHQHHRQRHGVPWAVAGGGRASAAAGGGGRGPWTATSGGGSRGGAWSATSGGGSRGGPWASTGGGGSRGGPRASIGGGGSRGGPWASTGGGGRGPWASTGGGRHALYAMAGGQWPGESATGRPGLRWSAVGRGWARTGQSRPFARSPDRGHGRHGWGTVRDNGGKDICSHGGGRWPWSEQPTEEPTVQPREESTEQPTEEPTVQPTEEPIVQPTEESTEQPTETDEDPVDPDEYEGSAFYPDESSDPPAVTEEAPVVPTPSEKEDCAEGAIFLDGECVCRDPQQFLDTILERCVDTRVVIY